jgi:hypothetical protein
VVPVIFLTVNCRNNSAQINILRFLKTAIQQRLDIERLFYYNKAMSILSIPTLLLPAPVRGRISLVIAPRQAIESLTALLAALAVQGQVNLVDGGNLFDGYGLTRLIRRQTTNVPQVLDNISLSRSFTCYPLVSVLKALPAEGPPLVVFDLLSTFLDESVPFARRRELLTTGLDHLQRISARSPVALWVRLRSVPSGEEDQLLPLVREIAHDVWRLENVPSCSPQLSLF